MHWYLVCTYVRMSWHKPPHTSSDISLHAYHCIHGKISMRIVEIWTVKSSLVFLQLLLPLRIMVQCVCLTGCVGVCVFICACTRTHALLCLCLCMCGCVCMCVCVCVCVYMCVCLCVYLCVCVHAYVRTLAFVTEYVRGWPYTGTSIYTSTHTRFGKDTYIDISIYI